MSVSYVLGAKKERPDTEKNEEKPNWSGYCELPLDSVHIYDRN